MPKEKIDEIGEWNNSILVQLRLRNNPLFEEPDAESKNGRYAGRNIISRDSPVQGGVYLGGGKREAIVVDETYENSELEKAYQELLARREAAVKAGQNFKTGLLTEVFNLTREKLKADVELTDEVSKKYSVGPDQKIALDVYIKEGVGVCRHQALLAAYLLERLKREGRISGHASVDRNIVPGRGGHAWVRYTNSVGEIYIMDPAQGYLGSLGNVQEDHQNGIGRWFYERPEDRHN